MNTILLQSEINKAFERSARLNTIKGLLRIDPTNADVLTKVKTCLDDLIKDANKEDDGRIIKNAGQLMTDTLASLKQVLAQTPHVSEETQKTLSKDNDPAIRKLLARNPHISEETQKTLHKDKEWVVRWTLACNVGMIEETKKNAE